MCEKKKKNKNQMRKFDFMNVHGKWHYDWIRYVLCIIPIKYGYGFLHGGL